jgi:hypothetical protein
MAVTTQTSLVLAAIHHPDCFPPENVPPENRSVSFVVFFVVIVSEAWEMPDFRDTWRAI